jgi:hypothetical protein
VRISIEQSQPRSGKNNARHGSNGKAAAKFEMNMFENKICQPHSHSGDIITSYPNHGIAGLGCPQLARTSYGAQDSAVILQEFPY